MMVLHSSSPKFIITEFQNYFKKISHLSDDVSVQLGIVHKKEMAN